MEQLVYMKYGNQVKIDENKLIKKINDSKNKLQKEYFLSEIIFKKKRMKTLMILLSK